jgi:hypothetical protein
VTNWVGAPGEGQTADGEKPAQFSVSGHSKMNATPKRTTEATNPTEQLRQKLVETLTHRGYDHGFLPKI